MMKHALILLFSVMLMACSGPQKMVSQQSFHKEMPPDIAGSIRSALAKTGDTIDYDTLLRVHQEMKNNQSSLPSFDELLTALINKTNDHPRVDSMILILAADIIGNSQTPIDHVDVLFETMFQQDHRLNLWVLSFIGSAIADYPYDIPEGNHLADLLEKKVAQKSLDEKQHPKEFFGHHFLPPPKGSYMINYIAGIEDQPARVKERMSYYVLLNSQWTEANIETALRHLQTQGVPQNEAKILSPLSYLVHYGHRP